MQRPFSPTWAWSLSQSVVQFLRLVYFNYFSDPVTPILRRKKRKPNLINGGESLCYFGYWSLWPPPLCVGITCPLLLASPTCLGLHFYEDFYREIIKITEVPLLISKLLSFYLQVGMNLLSTPYVLKKIIFIMLWPVAVKVLTFILTDSLQAGDSSVSEPLISLVIALSG